MIFLCLLLIMGGCWDKVEIDRRAVVLALGIDKYTKKGDALNKYLISYSFPNSSTGSSVGSSQGGGQGKPKFDISVRGRNFFDANRNIGLKLDKKPYYADAKTVVFGEELLKDPKLLKYTLDVIMRQNEFSKTASYVGAIGKAKKIIDSAPEANPLVGAYISSLISNNMASLKYPDGNAMRILSDLVSSGATIMPRVIGGKKNIKVLGCYVLKNYKLAGVLTGAQTKGLLFLKGEAQGGVYNSEKENEDFSYEIGSSNVNKIIDFTGSSPKVTYKINVSGNLAQYYNGKRKNFIGTIHVKSLQEEIQKGIKANIEKSLEKIQKECRVDVIGLGDYLSKYYPRRWKKLKGKWNDVFSNADIKISVKAIIDSLGASQ